MYVNRSFCAGTAVACRRIDAIVPIAKVSQVRREGRLSVLTGGDVVLLLLLLGQAGLVLAIGVGGAIRRRRRVVIRGRRHDGSAGGAADSRNEAESENRRDGCFGGKPFGGWRGLVVREESGRKRCHPTNAVAVQYKH